MAGASQDPKIVIAKEIQEPLDVLSKLLQTMLASPQIPMGLSGGQLSLWQLFEKMSVDPEKESVAARKTTFPLQGVGVLEGNNYVLHTHTPDDSMVQMLALIMFYYNSGTYSSFDNQTERFAACLNAHLHMVNQAVITQIRELYGKLLNGGFRMAAEARAEDMSTKDGASKGPLFSLETFRESFNNSIDRMNQLLPQLGAQPLDGQAVSELFELLGMPIPQEYFEGELTTYIYKHLLDVVFVCFVFGRMSDFTFHIKTDGGDQKDIEDLENIVLEQSFNEGFDETFDEHKFGRSALEEGYQRQLFNFYKFFWVNYLENIVPMLIIDYFNFVHGATLFASLLNMPFLRFLMAAGVDEEMNPLHNEMANEVLGWFLDDSNPSEARVEQEAKQGAKTSAKDPLVFRFADQELTRELTVAIETVNNVLQSYTRDVDNRRTVLTTSYFRTFEAARKLYNVFDTHLSQQDQSSLYYTMLKYALETHFSISEGTVAEYLAASKANQCEILGALFGANFADKPISYFALLNLCLRWIPGNGVPSFKYYLFNSYLCPVNLLGGDHLWYEVLNMVKEGTLPGRDSEGDNWIDDMEEADEEGWLEKQGDFRYDAQPIDLRLLQMGETNPLLTPPGMGVNQFN